MRLLVLFTTNCYDARSYDLKIYSSQLGSHRSECRSSHFGRFISEEIAPPLTIEVWVTKTGYPPPARNIIPVTQSVPTNFSYLATLLYCL